MAQITMVTTAGMEIDAHLLLRLTIGRLINAA